MSHLPNFKKHHFILLLVVAFVGVAFSPLEAQPPPSTEDQYEVNYKKRIKKQRLNGVYIPKDLFDAFNQLDRLMDEPTLNEFRLLPEVRAGRKFYLIMWVVNNWGFYEGSRLSSYISKIGITHPEHMAHFVIVAYHRHLNKVDLGIKERVEFYADKTKLQAEKNKTILHEEKRKKARPE